MGPGGALEGSLAVDLGFLKVSGPAVSIHDLLLLHLHDLLFDFLATRMGKARAQRSWARRRMPAMPARGSVGLEDQRFRAGLAKKISK